MISGRIWLFGYFRRCASRAWTMSSGLVWASRSSAASSFRSTSRASSAAVEALLGGAPAGACPKAGTTANPTVTTNARACFILLLFYLLAARKRALQFESALVESLAHEPRWPLSGILTSDFCLDPRAFKMQQLLLALDTPAVTGERTVRPHHTVARDSHGQRISGAGPRDGTRGVRLAEL